MNQGKYIRILLVALPVGLFLFGLASMLYTHLKPHAPENDVEYGKRMEAASLNRKPVNRQDLERFVRILSEEIGERHLEKPESLERAAIWIESTLKGGNFGYQVQKQTFAVQGKMVRNLIAELSGTKRKSEIIVVGAYYDTVKGCPGANCGGTGVAALLSLAQAFAGDPRERTLRFVFFVNEETTVQGTVNDRTGYNGPPGSNPEEKGSLVYAKSRFEAGENIVAVLNFASLGYFSDVEGSQGYPEGVPAVYPKVGNFIAFLGDEESRFRTDSAKSVFSRASGLPAISGTYQALGFRLEALGQAFSKFGYINVLATDMAKYRYPDFQKASDTLDKVDFAALEKVCAGLKAMVDHLAD